MYAVELAYERYPINQASQFIKRRLTRRTAHFEHQLFLTDLPTQHLEAPRDSSEQMNHPVLAIASNRAQV